MQLVLLGASGFAGGRILTEARHRGHHVLGVARNAGEVGEPSRSGTVHDERFVLDVTNNADALLVAVPARLMADGSRLLDAVPTLLTAAQRNGVRLGVVGGAGSLRVSPDGPCVIDTPEFPEEAKPEAGAHIDVLDALRQAPPEVDWFYLSPAATFGAYAPGERTGTYRTGQDALVVDADGNSTISGADYAIAFIDELDRPEHRRQRFTVGY